MELIKKGAVISTLILLIGCKSDTIELNNFYDAHPQTVSERIIVQADIADSLRLSTKADLYISSSGLRQDESYLYMRNRVAEGHEIWIFDKDGFELTESLSFEEGKGPSDIGSLSNYEFMGDYILLNDFSNSRFMRFRRDGLVEDIYLSELAAARPMRVIDFETVLTHSAGRQDYIFNKINLQTNEAFGFEELKRDSESLGGRNIMMYSGDIEIDDSHVYFAGYSEPILRKYNYDTGDLIYSVRLIDDFDSSQIYSTRTMDGGGIAMGYAPDALHAAVGIAVHDGLVFTPRSHNGKVGYQFIDVYDAQTGAYRESYETFRYPIFSGGIVVDDEFIYSIEYERGGSEYWLIKYKRTSS